MNLKYMTKNSVNVHYNYIFTINTILYICNTNYTKINLYFLLTRLTNEDVYF